MRAAAALLGLATLGCGEVERIELAVRPSQEDYAAHVQPLLERVGCSAGGRCHTVAVGDFRFVEQPGPADLQENYLGVKARMDLAQPERSLLLEDLLPAELAPGADHPTICWRSRESCTYRKLLAWAAWTGPGDLRPQDVDCDPQVDRCEARP